jgi:23S rRNA pseudouridine1911/1915/1917 synthase
MSTYTGQETTTITLQVPDGYREQGRLDKYITRFVENASRTKVQKSIDAGLVEVDGAVVTKAAHTVEAGATIVCTIRRPPPPQALPEDIPLDVVFEDDYLIVVNKAAGMVVHPAYGHRSGTLVNALLHHVEGEALEVEALEDPDDLDDETIGLSVTNALPSRAGDPAIRPGIVHRLDKDTSGLLVVAKDDVTHRGLAQQFQAHTTRRQYLALVWGVPEPPSGTVDEPLGRDPRDRKRMAVVAPGQGKEARTHYATVEAYAHTALLCFQLETGRTHQIRVHAQHLRHPVLGDPTYSGTTIRYGSTGRSRRAFFERLFATLPRQALHAHTLGFTHPRTDASMDFSVDPPDDFLFVRDELQRVEGS